MVTTRRRDSQRQSALFLSLVLFLIIGLVLISFLNLWTPIVFLGFILITFVFIYWKFPHFFLQLQEYERAVIFSKGKFNRIAGPGWVFLIPVLETYTITDTRTRTIDIGEQEVVTKDNVKLKIDAILYLKIQDPKKAILNVRDYEKASISNIQASLRSVVGQMKTSEVISHIDLINEKLRKNTLEVSGNWGIIIEKVEVESLVLPEGLQKAMHNLKEAEQLKLAAKEEAEGTKIKLTAVQEAASKFSQPTLQYMYLQSLQKIAEGKSSKIIFPMELSRLAASISDKFGKKYEVVQEEIVEKYKEKAAEGEKPRNIIKELQDEYGIKDLKLSKEEKELARSMLGLDFDDEKPKVINKKKKK